MPTRLTETAVITEAAAAEAKKSGRLPIQFISPGWGTSGYYSSAVLEQAAVDKVIPAGTHMYADHPTTTEDLERPVRSIKDLMAVTTEDARVTEDGALVGEAQVVPQWRDLLETVKDAIGVSIRGSATDIVEGEAEGKRGGIIEGLVAPVFSVDFVTRPGRGGKILPLLESAAANQRAMGHGVSEATVNDTREGLQTALRDKYGADKTYVWVRDFDDSTVWFEVESEGDAGIFGQGYSSTDGVVALTGERTEVRVVTNYVPATRPDSTTPTTEETLEVTMGNIQIDEAEHKRLVEQAGRVDTLITERDTDKARADKAERELAEFRRQEAASKIMIAEATKAKVTFTPLECRGLLADLPVTEAGDLDVEAFTKTVTENATAIAEAAAKDGSTGRVIGFGESANATESSSRPTKNAWGRDLTVKGA